MSTFPLSLYASQPFEVLGRGDGLLSVKVVSTPEEIEELAQRTCIGFINFSVLALCARNCSKFFVLEI